MSASDPDFIGNLLKRVHAALQRLKSPALRSFIAKRPVD